MKKSSVCIGILGLFSINVLAADFGLESCIQAAKKDKAGDLIKLEKLNVAGKGAYELELRDNNRNGSLCAMPIAVS